MTTHPRRIAVLGAGTVGRAVIRALGARSDRFATGDRPGLHLVAVAVRDVARAAAAGVPAGILSDAPAHVVAGDADIVVEVMGGAEPARTLIEAALAMGKDVVTANKLVVARHGPDLEATARRTGAALRFEAAVGGGIPILGPLAAGLAGNEVRRVRGIVNGTTNHILTAMTSEEDPREYAQALAEAQALGYAEADPAGDVEGRDAVDKLVILARLAFDRWLEPGAITTTPEADGEAKAGPGITTVSLADERDAKVGGRIIRLLATAASSPDGEIRAAALPTALPLDSALGRTAGVMNRIEVDAEPVGRVGFDGPGAGGGATASAILGDLVALAGGGGSTWAARPPATRVPEGVLRPPERETLRTSRGIRYPIDD